jgi:hypothetical protein
MNYSRWVALLLFACTAFCGTLRSEAGPMLLVNGGTNSLVVSNEWGQLTISNSLSYWPVGVSNFASCGGAQIWWGRGAGDWFVTGGDHSIVALDQNREQTYWWWAGFVLTTLWGLGTIGARWAKRAAIG